MLTQGVSLATILFVVLAVSVDNSLSIIFRSGSFLVPAVFVFRTSKQGCASGFREAAGVTARREAAEELLLPVGGAPPVTGTIDEEDEEEEERDDDPASNT